LVAVDGETGAGEPVPGTEDAVAAPGTAVVAGAPGTEVVVAHPATQAKMTTSTAIPTKERKDFIRVPIYKIV
jgi:hypothetical protein